MSDGQLQIRVCVGADFWAALLARLDLPPGVDAATAARVAFGRVTGIPDRVAARQTGGPRAVPARAPLIPLPDPPGRHARPARPAGDQDPPRPEDFYPALGGPTLAQREAATRARYAAPAAQLADRAAAGESGPA